MLSKIVVNLLEHANQKYYYFPMIEELTITLTNAGYDCLEYAILKIITSCEKEEPEKKCIQWRIDNEAHVTKEEGNEYDFD